MGRSWSGNRAENMTTEYTAELNMNSWLKLYYIYEDLNHSMKVQQVQTDKKVQLNNI